MAISLDPLAKYFQDPLTPYLGAVSRRAPEFTQDDESLLSEIAGGGLSALGWIGSTLDKTFGARTVRAILDDGFDLSDLAHLIPFSDTLGLTDSGGLLGSNLLANQSEVPGGRELLEQAGMLGENTPGLDWGDVAGFGAEVALDPSAWAGNWISKLLGTSLTPAGKVAKTVGALPQAQYSADALKTLQVGPRQQLLTKTLDDVLATPELRTAAEAAAEQSGAALSDLLSQPLGGGFFGTSQGPLAQKMAGMFDTAGDAISRTAPMRFLSTHFDPAVRDATSAPQQIAMRQLSKEMDAAKAGIREKLYDDIGVLDEAGLMKVEPDWMRDVLEERINIPQEFAGTPVEAALQNLKALQRQQRDEALSIGLDWGEGGGVYRGEKFGYDARQMAEHEASRRAQYAYERSPNSARRDEWQNLPTSVIKQISIDPVVAGAERTAKNNAEAAEHLLANYLDPDATLAKLKSAQRNVRAMKAQLRKEPFGNEALREQIIGAQQRVDEIKAARKNAEAIADRIRERPADLVKAGMSIFPNHPIQDALDGLVHGQLEITSHKKIFEGLRENAVRTAAATGGAGLVPIKDALRTTKLPTNVARQNMAKALGVTPKELKDFSVPADVVDQMTRIIESFKSPKSYKPLENLVRKFTNLFKLGVTAWPDFQVRNLYSGQAMNWFGGYFSPSSAKGIEKLIRDPKHTIEGLKGKGFFKSAKTDAEATEMLRRAWFSQKLTSYRQGLAGDVPGAFHDTTELLSELPGHNPAKSLFNVWGRFKEAIPTSWAEANPLNARGISDVPITKFAPAKVGEDVGYYVESLNRGVPFLEALKKGHTPGEAKQIADALQVDYARATRFESQKVKQLIPFYGWLKGIVPTLMRQLWEKPGGRMAQTIRLYNDLRDNDSEFVPERVGDGLAVGLGESAPGFQRYLSQIGMPFETLNNLYKPRPGLLNTITETGLGLLGQTNPLIKGPLELMTGRQFFQDRSLLDAYSPASDRYGLPAGVGRPLDQLLMNSPLAKLYSRLNLATDDRKGLAEKALLGGTGLRLTDVDVDKERDRAAIDYIGDKLRGEGVARTFSQAYVPKESLLMMTPEQQRLYALMGGLKRRARQRAKAEREQTAQ